MRRSLACTLTVVAFLAGCGDLPHDNPHDPQAPTDLQGHATLVGDITLEPSGATPPSLSAIHVSVAGHSWAADTDASGHYEISGVPVGTWIVQFTRPGWDDAVVSGVSITLDDAGERIPLPPMELKVSRGNIAGTVALEGEATASGVAVTLDAIPSASSVHWASALGAGGNAVFTDADGRFVLDGVPVGDYVLHASKVGFLDGTIGSVSVTPSGVTTLDALTLFIDPGGFSGSVLVQAAASSGSVTVRATGTTLNGSPWESTTVDRDDGTFLLSGIPGGSYNVRFERDGCAPALVSAAVRPGEITALPPVVMAPATGVVTGTVALDVGPVLGLPLPADRSGIVVTIAAAGQAVNSVTTDAAGAYRFVGVPVLLDGQSYDVTARLSGYVQTVPVHVAPRPSQAVAADTVTLEVAAGVLQGTVVLWDNLDGAGQNASSAGTVVSLSGVTFNGAPWSASATTDQNGRFTASNLPPGTYDLTATSAGRACDLLPRTAVAPGGTATLAAARCRDTVAPGALVLGPPKPVGAEQVGYTHRTSIDARVVTQATDASGNLRGYQTSIGSTPDWTGASLVEGTPATLPFTLTPDALSAGNQKFVLWARAVDWAGNTGPAASVELVYDGVKPATPTIATPRELVNATTTSVSLSGSDGPNFLGYEYYTTPCQDGSPSCPFVSTPASFAISLPADQSTVLHVRGVDWAGNYSEEATATLTSDLRRPTPPVFAPSYDPYLFTVRAPWVDFSLVSPAQDPSHSGDWAGVAWLEVDVGMGYQPLCASAACQDQGSWSPCTCACPDVLPSFLESVSRAEGPKLLCNGGLLVGFRAPLSAGTSTPVSFRAIDLAGNVGADVSQQVLADRTSDMLTATTEYEGRPRLRGTLATYRTETVRSVRLIDLGPNRRLDSTDPRCTLSQDFFATQIVPAKQGLVVFSIATGLGLRRPGADGVWCTGDDGSGVMTFSQPCSEFDARGETLACLGPSGVAGADALVVREPGPDGLLGTSDDPTGVVATFGPASKVSLGTSAVLVQSCHDPIPGGNGSCSSEWRVYDAGPTGSFLSGATVVTFPEPASSPVMSDDGKAIAWLDGSRLVIWPARADGRFYRGDALVRHDLPPGGFNAWEVAMDGAHVVATSAVSDARIVDWWAGPDGRWGTADDAVRFVTTGTALRSAPSLSGGLLAFETQHDVGYLDLSTLRWELPLIPRSYYLGTGTPTTNGSGTLLYAQDVLYARSPEGVLSSGPNVQDPLYNDGAAATYTASGSDLLTVNSTRGLDHYAADGSGVFFRSGPARVYATSNALRYPSLGGGKAIVAELIGDTAFVRILEPNGGSLRDMAGTGTVVAPDAGGITGIYGGVGPALAITARQAFFPCQPSWRACVRGAGANGRFENGGDDVPTTALLHPSNSPSAGTPFSYTVEMHASDDLLVVDTSAAPDGLWLVSAGPDGMFNTSDDRERRLSTATPGGLGVVAVGGDWVAWLDVAEPGGPQVFVMHGIDGSPTQVTRHYSAKSQLSIDATGRTLWLDGVMNPKAMMIYQP